MKGRNLLSILIVFTIGVFSQSCQNKFQDLLEPNSKLIKSGYNYTVEKLQNGMCIYKQFYNENNMITHYITYESDKLEILHGLFQEKYDDGIVVSKGMFSQNLRQGSWTENVYQSGYYKDGYKEGIWETIDDDANLLAKFVYDKGVLKEKQVFDEHKFHKTMWHRYPIELSINMNSDSLFIMKQMPRFPGCEDSNLNILELDKCARQKLLDYIYANLKYPKRSRLRTVQGMAVMQFVVEKDGSISNIKALYGLTKEIKQATIKVLENMPAWIPGTIDNEPASIHYILPIKFMINN